MLNRLIGIRGTSIAALAPEMGLKVRWINWIFNKEWFGILKLCLLLIKTKTKKNSCIEMYENIKIVSFLDKW